ncbi:MAG: hypothetical protein R3D70_21425 [Rhizobiaceae bacterium]
MEDLATLVAANEEAAAAIASAYEVLLGGVPNVAGFTFVINSAIASGIADFNQENIFINVVNSPRSGQFRGDCGIQRPDRPGQAA